MRRCLLYLMLLIIALVPATAAADTLTFVNYPAGFTDGTYYVADAAGKLNELLITMWCIDAKDHITQNQWNVIVVSLADPTGLAGVLGLTVDQFKAMFLLGQGFSPTDQALDVSLQHEIWNFTDPADFPLTPAQKAQVAAVLASVGNYDWSHAYVLLETGNQCSWVGQLFNEGSAPPKIPEPGTLVLLGLGLLIVGPLYRRLQRW